MKTPEEWSADWYAKMVEMGIADADGTMFEPEEWFEWIRQVQPTGSSFSRILTRSCVRD